MSGMRVLERVMSWTGLASGPLFMVSAQELHSLCSPQPRIHSLDLTIPSSKQEQQWSLGCRGHVGSKESEEIGVGGMVLRGCRETRLSHRQRGATRRLSW